MLRVDIRHVEAGMCVALPVYHPEVPGQTLLKINAELTPKVIDRLRGMGVTKLWVRYPSLSAAEGFVSLDNLRAQSGVTRQLTGAFDAVQSGSNAKLEYRSYTRAITELVEALLTNPQSALFLDDLVGSGGRGDAALLNHSANVTYLSVLMGLRLQGYLVRQRKFVPPRRAGEVVNLGVGAMLHDVGLTRLSDEARKVYAWTGDETAPGVREHPAIGFRLVRGQASPTAASIVLHHHQRWDGSGYAGKGFPVLDGPNTHVFARIVAVADTFDQLRGPVGLPAQHTAWVLSQMVQPPMLRVLDLQVVKALLAVTPPYPPGTRVILSDGRSGAVVDHNPDAPCRPVVQMIPEEPSLDDDGEAGMTIDLAQSTPGLFVAWHEDVDVSVLNFEVPSELQRVYLASA